MYERVPMNVLAMESINWPLTPKSQSFISPDEFIRILDGLTSFRVAKKCLNLISTFKWLAIKKSTNLYALFDVSLVNSLGLLKQH